VAVSRKLVDPCPRKCGTIYAVAERGEDWRNFDVVMDVLGQPWSRITGEPFGGPASA
jgi:hypothetical protein